MAKPSDPIKQFFNRHYRLASLIMILLTSLVVLWIALGNISEFTAQALPILSLTETKIEGMFRTQTLTPGSHQLEVILERADTGQELARKTVAFNILSAQAPTACLNFNLANRLRRGTATNRHDQIIVKIRDSITHQILNTLTVVSDEQGQLLFTDPQIINSFIAGNELALKPVGYFSHIVSNIDQLTSGCPALAAVFHPGDLDDDGKLTIGGDLLKAIRYYRKVPDDPIVAKVFPQGVTLPDIVNLVRAYNSSEKADSQDED